MDYFDSSNQALNVTISSAIEHLTKSTGYDDYAILFFSLLGLIGYISNGRIWGKPDPNLYKWYERPQEALQLSSASQATRNIADKLVESNGDAVIFWGSQSGTAEGYAHRLAKDLHRRFKLVAIVADLSDYDVSTISLIPDSKLAIFIMSTYGEGDPSDNAAEFWDWVAGDSIDLKNLCYAAFGLGNSNYKYYNKVIDVVVSQLNHFGAKLLLPVGKADDATNGNEEDFLDWKERLCAHLRSERGLQEFDLLYEAAIKVVEDGSLDLIDLHLGTPVTQSTRRRANGEMSTVNTLQVADMRSLTSNLDNDRQCVHLELDMTQHVQLKYKTGDHLAIWPVNPSQEVSRLLRILTLEESKDQPLLISSIDSTNKSLRVPSPTTAHALFQNYLEICAPVSRETVQALSQFAPSDKIKTTLQALAGDKSVYSTFLASNHITLGLLLEYCIQQDPSSAKWEIPLSFVIESLQPLTPRFYSISSSSAISPRKASITVAVSALNLQSNTTLVIPGLASTYLSKLDRTSQPSVYASIRRSTFKLPMNHLTPLVLIASGTGIAPFRAFIHERARLASLKQNVGPILLVYGCRHPEVDYLYRMEFEDLKSGPLKDKLEIIHAFSRLPNEKKVYVQDRISEHAQKIAKLVADDDGMIYFCGSTVMAKSAGEQIIRAVGNYRQLSEDEATRWHDEKKGARRWLEDVWG